MLLLSSFLESMVFVVFSLHEDQNLASGAIRAVIDPPPKKKSNLVNDKRERYKWEKDGEGEEINFIS